ncbi:MAG: septum formation initiator family protein [Candidatus Aminicenantes bacterium]|jgi:cell division protein FtsB|nr:septum formation initiator family protein [Candidatus Aminicenantes bacterium]
MKKKIFVLGVACLLLIMVFTAVFGKKGVMDLRRSRRELAAQADRIRALEAERDRLTAEIRRLETDPRAVEKAAREKLGLAAPGEKVVVDPAPPVKK